MKTRITPSYKIKTIGDMTRRHNGWNHLVTNIAFVTLLLPFPYFISLSLTYLPQWSHVWHPEQMIHALVEWQETRVYQVIHPKEHYAMVLDGAFTSLSFLSGHTIHNSVQLCRFQITPF